MAWIVAAVLLSVALRARMLFTPLNADEGGYLAIARAWAHGRVLYRDVWIDRPQGLLGLFRIWSSTFGGHASSIRAMAMVFGALLVTATAAIAWSLYGALAARWTAVVCAVASSAPMLEGYIPNGELLSGAVATTGLAVALAGLARRHEARWMVAAGVLTGAALSIKQSAFDAAVALAIWSAAVAVADPRRRRRAARAAAWFGAGCLVVLAVVVADAALTGWQRWWDAIVGYRSATSSLFHDPSWKTLRRTARYGALVLAPALLVGTIWLARRAAARATGRRRLPHADLLTVSWLGAATFAFLLGGGYWRHYWLLLAAPISLLAGAAIGHLRRAGPLVAALVVAPALVAAVWVFAGDSRHLTARAASDARAVLDQRVADWYLAHRQTDDTLYVLGGEPAVYADAGEDPPLPYLWFPEVVVAPHAVDQLLAYLTSTPPTYIAQYANALTCDPSGRVKALVDQRYRKVATVGGVTILSLASPSPARP